MISLTFKTIEDERIYQINVMNIQGHWLMYLTHGIRLSDYVANKW